MHSKEGNVDAIRFSFSHAQFVWDCKSEPGVRDLFAQIWGTDKLTVSFGIHDHIMSAFKLTDFGRRRNSCYSNP